MSSWHYGPSDGQGPVGEDPIVIERFITPDGQCTLCYFGIHVHRIKSEEEKDNMDLAMAQENRWPLDVDYDKGVGGREEFASTSSCSSLGW